MASYLKEFLMSQPHVLSDPFAMLLDPDAVLRAVRRSERLNRLRACIHHPLDKLKPALAAGPRPPKETGCNVQQAAR